MQLLDSTPATGDAVIQEPYIDEAPVSAPRAARYAIALGALPWVMCAMVVGLAATAHVIDPLVAAIGWTIGLALGVTGGVWGTRLRGGGATAATVLGLWAPYVTFSPTVLAVLLTNDWLF